MYAVFHDMYSKTLIRENGILAQLKKPQKIFLIGFLLRTLLGSSRRSSDPLVGWERGDTSPHFPPLRSLRRLG